MTSSTDLREREESLGKRGTDSELRLESGSQLGGGVEVDELVGEGIAALDVQTSEGMM